MLDVKRLACDLYLIKTIRETSAHDFLEVVATGVAVPLRWGLRTFFAFNGQPLTCPWRGWALADFEFRLRGEGSLNGRAEWLVRAAAKGLDRE